MAPELFNGSRVDEAADVYSLACILYEAWSRRTPFSELASANKSYNVLFKVSQNWGGFKEISSTRTSGNGYDLGKILDTNGARVHEGCISKSPHHHQSLPHHPHTLSLPEVAACLIE
jgi:serine/threonine protein kinase